MKTKSIIFSLMAIAFSFIILNSPARAEWEKTFGGTEYDYGYSVQQTNDGGFIVAGQTTSFGAGGYDVYLVKTDKWGTKQWEKTFGGTETDFGNSVQQTSDGGFIIAGYTNSFGAGGGDVYLIKTDLWGKMEWEKTFGGTGGDYGKSVQQTNDGGFIIAGYRKRSSTSSYDVYLVKTDPNGTMQWEGDFGDSRDDYGYSVRQTNDGGFIIAGYDIYDATYPDKSCHGILLKTDSSGTKQWEKNFYGINDAKVYSVQQTKDGGFIVTGCTWDPYYGSSNDKDVYLGRIDSDGIILWETNFGGTEDDYGQSVWQTNDGGFIIAGYTYSFGAGGTDFYLVKTDDSGNSEAVQWEETFGGTGYDGGQSVQQTKDGGFIIAGYTDSFGAGRCDVFLVKVDPKEPIPDIKANFSDGPITVPPNYPVSITFSLDSGGYYGKPADWWIVLQTPTGPYSYVRHTGWEPGLVVSSQIRLYDLYPPFQVFNGRLPVGNYRFDFFIDKPDGIPQGTWMDSVVVHVVQ